MDLAYTKGWRFTITAQNNSEQNVYIRQRMIEDMRLRNFSPNTQSAYVQAVAVFAKHFKTSPEKLTGQHVRQYLLFLIQERKVSVSLYNIARCALRFLYQITLGRDER